MKNIIILGSKGNIGSSLLKYLSKYKKNFNTIGFDLSISNQYQLYGTAIANEIGLGNYDNNIKAGFQINKIFN